MKRKILMLLLLLSVLALCLGGCCNCNGQSASEKDRTETEYTDWMETFENTELVVGEKYIVKDVRDVEKAHPSRNANTLIYYTYLILEPAQDEPVKPDDRIVYEYTAFSGEQYNMWAEMLYGDSYINSVEGQTYNLTLFVPGDVIIYQGNNEFEVCAGKEQ